jgi:amyloid beta precursor protein binding protein 1
LRISEPFEELAKYVDSFDFSVMDSTDHSHTPYIIILLKAMNQWKASHGGQLPSTRAEKEEFKSIVIKGSRNPSEENFNEAYRGAHKAFTKHSIPSSVSNILKDNNAINITPNSSKFWILASALKGFVENEGAGLLPLMGTIPDMTASTNGYIALQKVYQDKSNADISAVQARVKNILQSIGKPETFITFEETKKFCKNALFLQVVRYRSLLDEYSTPKSLFSSSNLDTHLSFYIALRAVDDFYSKHKRYPGYTDATVAADVTEILKESTDLIKKLGATSFNTDHIVEL